MKISLEEQSKILKNSLDNGTKLSDLLALKNLTYEDLRYIDGLEKVDNNFSSMEFIDDISMLLDKIPAVSFFSGAGGLDIGFRYAGFKNIIGIEHMELFCNTLRLNNPKQLVIGPPFYSGDISNRKGIASILRGHGIDFGFNGVFHGGPPCQSFSIAANQRFKRNETNFKRTGFADQEKGMLIFDYIWYIKEFRPLAFLIENVSGIAECDEDRKIDKALDELRSLGYSIPNPQILDAAYFGVPQHRKRWIALGTRGSTPIEYPTPQKEETPCGSVFLKPIDGISNHITRLHKAESLIRYSKLTVGERDHLGRVDRLDPNKPSKTVIAGGVKGGGRSHLHPYIPRTISVRECARLQTFPDNYVFTGTTARQFTQVGNAVPPMLAYKLALKIHDAIIKDYNSDKSKTSVSFNSSEKQLKNRRT